MKKIFTIICSAVFMCGVFQNMAKADCKLISCGDIDPFNASVPADVGGNQCWFCGPGPNSCNNHDVVPFMDSVGDVIKLRQCSIGWESFTFLEYAPAIFCKDSPLHPDKGNVDTTNAKVTYRLTGSATKPTNLGDWNVFTGSASCKYVKCNTGYLPNADKTACVAASRESNCSASGGTWNGSACQCDSNKGLKQNSGNTACVCKNSGYEYVARTQKCEESEESKKLRDQKKNEQVKNKCIGSGGTWNPTSRSCNCSASKNLIRSGEVCVCTSAEYTKSSDGKSCVF